MDIDTFIVESRRLRSKGTKSLPDMSHQSKEESNYLKLHKCRDGGEAYSASYLITKEHLRYQNTAYNLSWVNCEMGSFIMMNGNANPQKSNINGTIIQSLDVLDFAVVHLSAYERLQRRWGLSVEKSLAAKLPINITNNRKTKAISIPWNISAVTESAELLRAHALKVRRYSSELLSTPQLNRTIVVMPFLGADMGAGHSKLHNRLQYLHACFWSFYAKIPHIVAFVKNDKDYQYARNTSNLPFFDVVLLDNLPKSASLPVATVQQTKARLMDGRWDFDFIFFTESDQLLMFRIPDVVYSHLRMYPRRFLSPHRLMPYPELVLTEFHNRSLSPTRPFDWLDMNCCLPRQNCGNRKSWLSVKNSSTAIVNVYGFQVPLGNVNFHEETYRTCSLTQVGGVPICP